MRIFQIGFNKCGTSSLHNYFTNCGLRSVHWEKGMLAKNIHARMVSGDDPIADYGNINAFTDMIYNSKGDALLEPYKRFDYLHAWHPEALFILNTRRIDNWLASRAAHNNTTLPEPFNRWVPRYMHYLGISEIEVMRYWEAERLVHHAQVRAYFRDNPRFLEFDIEGDPTVLTRFMSRYVGSSRGVPFPHSNKT